MTRAFTKYAPDTQAASDALVETDQSAPAPFDGDMSSEAGDSSSALHELETGWKGRRQAVALRQQMSEELSERRSKSGPTPSLRDEDRSCQRPFLCGVLPGEALEHIRPCGRWWGPDTAPPDWVQLKCHCLCHNRGRCTGLAHDATGSHRAGQHTCKERRMSPAEAVIVSYGLPNYAIRIRPYAHGWIATLEMWPARMTAPTTSGPRTLNAWPSRFDEPANTLVSARSRSHTEPG